MNYNSLMNKPTINYRELIGDNSVTEVGGITEEEFNTLMSTDLASYYTKAQIDDLFSRSYVYREKSGSIVTFDCPSTSQTIPEVTVGIEAVQAGNGDPSPTNVRPISGWSAVNVYDTGKNFYDYSKSVDAGGGTRNLIINLPPNTDFVFSLDTTVNGMYIKGSNDNFVTQTDIKTAYGVSSTTFNSQNYKSYLLSLYKNGGASERDNIKLELGTTPTTYEAYNGTTTPIAFTVNGETKTIYSGYVEIKNGKVKAVAESKFNTFTELSALYSGVGNDVVCAFISANEMKSNSRSNGMSNYFNPVTTIINENVPWRVCFGINNQRIFFTFDPEVIGGNTLADINNYVAANPIQVVYPLTTPIEYDLSDVSISTKDGTNNLWADSGDIEVKCLDRIIPAEE